MKAPLFQRLAGVQKSYDLLDDIARNIKQVLGTRRIEQLDYGLHDLSQYGFGNKAEQDHVCLAVIKQIELHEPRVCDVNVFVSQTASCSLTLRITAKIIEESQLGKWEVFIESSSRNIDVKKVTNEFTQ